MLDVSVKSAAQDSPPPAPARIVVQWSCNGESRIPSHEMELVEKSLDGLTSDNVRSAFPLHLSCGSLVLSPDGFTVWLQQGATSVIAGEAVDASLARPKGIPSSGVVDIRALAPEVQEAIARLLKAATR